MICVKRWQNDKRGNARNDRKKKINGKVLKEEIHEETLVIIEAAVRIRESE